MLEMSEKTNLFEVMVAVLLGLGAIGGAWANFQAGQWGSTSVEDYGKSATTATKAATLFNVAVSSINRDNQLDIKGKEMVLHAITAKDPLDKERDMTIAKYLYTQQMSDEGYKALGYPAEFRTRDKDKASAIPDEAMIDGLEKELDDKYTTEVLAPGTQRFAEADKIFKDGQEVSGLSTKFGLDSLFFTITLFLAGLALVFKSPVRWVFLALGGITLVFASSYLMTLKWY